VGNGLIGNDPASHETGYLPHPFFFVKGFDNGLGPVFYGLFCYKKMGISLTGDLRKVCDAQYLMIFGQGT
jgi:hypothetical protein